MLTNDVYTAIVYGTARGRVAEALINKNWSTWISIVKSSLGHYVEQPDKVAEELANKVYIDTLWSVAVDQKNVSELSKNQELVLALDNWINSLCYAQTVSASTVFIANKYHK